MRESIFKFKQFSVRNSQSAMKVGTDGVLLGAWCDVKDDDTILDVGAGTGLISLMVAQRCNATIIGLELSLTAAQEAKVNIEESKWNDRITIVNQDFNIYVSTENLKFTHIISNPPYFDAGIKSQQEDRAIARHTDSLSYYDLLSNSFRLLTNDGRLSIITPHDVKDKILMIIEEIGLKLSRLTEVYPKPNSKPKRLLWEFSKDEKEVRYDSLSIEIERHKYTPEYVNLTKNYYLKM